MAQPRTIDKLSNPPPPQAHEGTVREKISEFYVPDGVHLWRPRLSTPLSSHMALMDSWVHCFKTCDFPVPGGPMKIVNRFRGISLPFDEILLLIPARYAQVDIILATK